MPSVGYSPEFAATQRLHVASSLADAVAALAARGPGCVPLAGATWIMRAPLRGEPMPISVVALSGIAELREIAITEDAIGIGACVTHARLAAALADLADLRALAQAAGQSANPAIREMATVGGNLCALGFAAADLVPALLCLDAQVELATQDGPVSLPLADFLDRRGTLPPGVLIRRVIVPRTARHTAHARLPLRRAGDYPVAIVSLSLTLAAGRIATARVAVGAVEPAARRWRTLEARLAGQKPDPSSALADAEALSGEFVARDDIAAPGWYRRKILPVLVQRALAASLA
jgi:carbon-monoxide dehydrogenase medium subunit